MAGDKGYMWRKYGEKSIGGRKKDIRRSYYRCVTTHSPCPARKRVDCLVSSGLDDPPLSVSLIHRHNHAPRHAGNLGLLCPLQTSQGGGGADPWNPGVDFPPLKPVAENTPVECLAQEMVKDLEMQLQEGQPLVSAWGRGWADAEDCENTPGAGMNEGAEGVECAWEGAGEDGGSLCLPDSFYRPGLQRRRPRRVRATQTAEGSGDMGNAEPGKEKTSEARTSCEFEEFCRKSREAKSQGDAAEKLLMGLLGMSPPPSSSSVQQSTCTAPQGPEHGPGFGCSVWFRSASGESLTSPEEVMTSAGQLQTYSDFAAENDLPDLPSPTSRGVGTDTTSFPNCGKRLQAATNELSIPPVSESPPRGCSVEMILKVLLIGLLSEHTGTEDL